MVVPFRKIAVCVFDELQRRVLNPNGPYEEEMKYNYFLYSRQLSSYIEYGIYPSNGLFERIGNVKTSNGRLDVYSLNEACSPEKYKINYMFSLYSIFTLSTHTDQIRSKYTGGLQSASFIKELDPNIRYYRDDSIFNRIVVERGRTIDFPFLIKGSHNVLIGSKSSDYCVSLKLMNCILDGVDARLGLNQSYRSGSDLNKLFSYNLFIYDNQDIDASKSINGACEKIKHSYKKNEIAIKFVELRAFDDNIFRVTVSDINDSFEDYFIFRFIDLPNYRDMLKFRVEYFIGLFEDFLNSQDIINSQDILDCDKFLSDLNKVEIFLEKVEVKKYEDYLDYRFYDRTGLLRYNPPDFFRKFPDNTFIAIYELFETYNNYFDISKSRDFCLFGFHNKLLHENINHSLKSMAKIKSNYIKDGDKKSPIKFRNETEITKQLSSYIDNADFHSETESSESGGRTDIKIRSSNSNVRDLIIEVKLIKDINKSVEVFKRSVVQLENYTQHGEVLGMLIFFTLDLNEDEVLNHIEKRLDSNLIKVRDSNLVKKFKIKRLIKINDEITPIRFVKLNSISPSKQKLN